jgi:hypothetical protein
MSTIVTLYNASASHGGACNCNDLHVQGPAKSSSVGTIEAGQTAHIDLSQQGWDQYDGQECELAARCSGCSGWRHSAKFIYQLDKTYHFDWYGPSSNPQIEGPN